ncbi:MAG: amylo-alpha-1,6-glucosidase [Syntrophales bacterium]|nr:amylo-alpha-1,6-glucosidase [Syntrophales bacterium]
MPDIIMEDSSCLDPREALGLEWLDANGKGGYASSTVMNCHTRKYHGLLVANFNKPSGRQVILSKFEDSLQLGKEEYFFSCHQYPGLFFQGPRNCLASFNNVLAPKFTYQIDGQIDGIVLHKTIMLFYGEDCVLVKYEFENLPSPSLLRIRPFLAYRGFHILKKQNMLFDTKTCDVKNGFKITPYPDMPSFFIQTSSRSQFSSSPLWYYNFEYQEERQRGYSWREDLFLPGVLEIPVKSGNTVIVSASLKINSRQLLLKWKGEEKRRAGIQAEESAIVEKFTGEDRDNLRQLLRAGRQFITRTPDGRPAIIAGYHWFDDWGRDTLISLPGLAFCCGRPQEGTAILESLGKYEKNGLLPNFFSTDGKGNGYNSVDASLWYFWTVQQMLKYTGDLQKIRASLWPVMKNIIKNFLAGTVFDIHMSDNGLLHAGNRDTNLTWMDATVGGRPVTPRWGFPVEINALWYNAICFAGELAGLFGEPGLFPADLPARIERSFQDTFWIEEGAYLGDVFSQGALDHAVRPNQIFALSLPFSPLSPAQAAGVVNKVKANLLTPCGLRTLSPDDRAYQGRYEGNEAKRDGAYHQGTVWPWMLASFGEACLKVAEDKKEAKVFLLENLRSFLRRHLWVAGVGCISEIFDGDSPHTPRGCISQAWSTGELIRLYSILQET